MWRRGVAEVLAIAAVATGVTLVIGTPVLLSPTERLFGMPIVGRHYDPFAVMTQMTAPFTAALYLQPVTDVPAALASRLIGPVAAYNWIVLTSFPLSAAMAFMLARYLGLSRLAAAVAAIAYAFSPFHLAHAAYHAHVAQTQWLPLYLLALFRCLDRATPKAVALLAAATLAVTLSNFYGGMIAAVITPFAVAGHWWANSASRTTRSLAIAIATLGATAMSAGVYAAFAAQRIAAQPAELAYQRSDLFRYGARWWSYLVPPVEHPLLGTTALRIWNAAGMREGLLEQQVALGFGIVILALIGASGWWLRDRSRATTYVPMLIVVALVAFACSLSPEPAAGLTIRPAAWLYDVAPMFRSYARFGLVVQLAAVLLAGFGIDRLRRAGTTRAVVLCVALMVLALAEYLVPPSAMSRDVLPTMAHRWVIDHDKHARVLDCAPITMESESIGWLSRGRIALAGAAIANCADTDLPARLAANGFTHLIERPPFDNSRSPESGLALEAGFDDGRLYAVTARPPAIYTAATGDHGMQVVVNTAGVSLPAMLRLQLSGMQGASDLEINLDGRCVQALRVQPGQQFYEIGPIQVSPGSHELVLHPVDATSNGNPSFAVGASQWRVAGQ